MPESPFLYCLFVFLIGASCDPSIVAAAILAVVLAICIVVIIPILCVLLHKVNKLVSLWNHIPIFGTINLFR